MSDRSGQAGKLQPVAAGKQRGSLIS